MVYHISIDDSDLAKVVQLRACMGAFITECRANGWNCTMEERIIGNRHVFLCVSGVQSRTREREWLKQLAKAMAEYICGSLEPEMIRTIIQQEYRILSAQEITQVEHYAERLLEGSAWEHARVIYVNRRDKLAKQIWVFLRENNRLAVDGFVRFRMKSYRTALSKCVRDAVEEYVLDREYKEFIQLLKYFLSVQTSKMALVHVIHEGKSRFRILKADGSPLRLKEMGGALQEVLEYTFSHEDFIVSTLLTLAPEQVVLHTKNPGENVVRTLIQIFEERIVVCNGCGDCGIPLNFHSDA
ncbi:putative sporulation protein YtxC [Lihuaxuella thermophila]|uniref:Putative sporulation protein YtxC n=1 Tax=Lihuaxuella thermophila TaxID=1173111 RepID=A0A1H8CT58_9BACL|nr:putative sporulation protein YtxC [Lihuaxuella thermophila]SEM98196.1 putative sporulation protein YtxC [Lihuaxuella thermophila]